MDKNLLRIQVRALRHALTANEQETTAKQLAETVLTQTHFTLGDHIALYMDADGEAGTRYLLNALLDAGKACYLPVLVEPTTTLEFRQYLPEKPLVTNFFGLQEPEISAKAIEPENLTAVLLPLVAFDLNGNRLGMGKGYYDRTFAFIRRKTAAGPVLIGLAHECQRVEKLEASDWDVPLGGIITGRQLYLTG
jgi:5-formyltetrahydrofolate cyclo-ligase